jgi:trehalose 6-phosphate phosphatase
LTAAPGDHPGALGRFRNPRSPEDLRRLRSAPRSCGIFLDFDGTLADIVARPELAQPLPEVPALLAQLSSRYGLVAVVTGRPAPEARLLLAGAGPLVEVVGLYGLEARPGPTDDLAAVRGQVEAIVARVSGSRLEDKGMSLAVHYRGSSDPDRAAADLSEALVPLTSSGRLVILPGKMVLELVPAGTPGKGWVVARQYRERGLRGCLYAGDDLADLDAFAALETLRAEGAVTVRVAISSEEAPPALISSADVVVNRPAGLVALLSRALV